MWVMALSARTRNLRPSRTDGAPTSSLKEEHMTHRIRPRSPRVLLALAVALLAAFALPGRGGLPFGAGTAEAAYYAVPVCNDAGGVNNSWSYTPLSGGAEIAHGQGCPNARFQSGNTNIGMFVRNVADNNSTPYGSGGKWQFTAQGGNTVQSISFDGWATRGGFG